MTRVPPTICAVCLVLGLTAGAQQVRTGTAVPPRPSPTPWVVPRPPAPKPEAGSRTGSTPGPAARAAEVPKKNPGAVQTTPPSAQLSPMGPPAPPPEVPKPMRPADEPPLPPQVTYRNGLLTVNAVNSTLGGLLNAIRAKTGIEFEGGENASERVAVNLGPAAEGEVLAGIFSGSSFDYVVLGRADSPTTVQRVILTPKTKGGPVLTGGPLQPQRPQVQPAQQAQQESEEEAPDEAAAAEPDPQDSAIQPPPVQQPPTAQNQQIQPNEQQQQPNGPKTPEQLLEELKQMQLQQQQQQGQAPPNPNSVPRKPPN